MTSTEPADDESRKMTRIAVVLLHQINQLGWPGMRTGL
jgi:hypothetical protein